MNLTIAHAALSDAGTLSTAASVAGNMPLANLQAIQPTDATRFLTPGSAYFELDLGSAKAIDFVALLNTNGSSAATWRVRADSTQAGLSGGSPGYDSTTKTLWPSTGLDDWDFVHALLNIGADKTFRWWRVDIADASNPDGYFQAGRLLLADAWRPTHGLTVAEGAELGWRDPSAWNVARGGQTYVDAVPRARFLRFGVTLIDDTELFPRGLWLDRTRGSSRDVLVSLDPDHATLAQDWTLCGLMKELSPARTQDINRWQKRFEIEELL